MITITASQIADLHARRTKKGAGRAPMLHECLAAAREGRLFDVDTQSAGHDCLWIADDGDTALAEVSAAVSDDATVPARWTAELVTLDVAASALEALRAEAATLAQPDARDALRAEERGLAAAVSRLTAALEHAGDVPEIAARLRSQSERLREVRAELARADKPPPTVAPADLDAAVADLRRDLEGDTAAARDVLGLLLLGRVRLTGGGRGRPVAIEAEAHVGRLVTADAGGMSGALTGGGHTPRPGVVVLRAAA